MLHRQHSGADSTARVPDLATAKRRVAEYVDSGRYAADIAAVVTRARTYLDMRLTQGGKLAIVLDIDETALSNLPQLRANDYGFIIAGSCADLPRGRAASSPGRCSPGPSRSAPCWSWPDSPGSEASPCFS